MVYYYFDYHHENRHALSNENCSKKAVFHNIRHILAHEWVEAVKGSIVQKTDPQIEIAKANLRTNVKQEVQLRRND